MRRCKVVTILVILAFACTLVYAAGAAREAKIASIKGKADVRFEGKGTWIEANKGMTLKQGDELRTRKGSTVMLYLNGSAETATVKVEPSSNLRIAELTKDSIKGTQSTLLDLSIGEVLIRAEKLDSPESKFEVKTPTSMVGVRGTKFSVRVEAME